MQKRVGSKNMPYIRRLQMTKMTKNAQNGHFYQNGHFTKMTLFDHFWIQK